ncbi:hypothetical protein KRR38_07915 [Novosphingobium sp. G106]|uniref:hypothetical protein n=1 Tax=Novosphingobium sp. G106 TaxID=2849500 RepID=UPI001C2D677A|nr:hypothetical protein [Novosphingobium sp. G106]MBV1687608.1 hypothetical protein [Novosphingobium sp. G106]
MGAAAFLVLSLSGCEDGSTPPLTAVSPTPSPSPSPSPTPTPTPTPVPATRIGQADIGQSFGGPMACAGGTFARTAQSDGTTQMSGIASLTAPRIDNRLQVGYPAENTYKLDTNGMGGPTFDPVDKKAGPTFVYDYFRDGADEFEIYRNKLDNKLFFVTIGRYSDNSQLCFYAAGGPPAFVHPGNRFQAPLPFLGFGDGIFYSNGTALRLLESAAKADVNYISSTVAITLTLRGRAPVFGEVANSTTEETVTTRAQISPNGSITGNLTGGQWSDGHYRRSTLRRESERHDGSLSANQGEWRHLLRRGGPGCAALTRRLALCEVADPVRKLVSFSRPENYVGSPRAPILARQQLAPLRRGWACHLTDSLKMPSAPGILPMLGSIRAM